MHDWQQLQLSERLAGREDMGSRQASSGKSTGKNAIVSAGGTNEPANGPAERTVKKGRKGVIGLPGAPERPGPVRELLVSDFGAFVGIESERVQVRLKGKTVTEVPLLDLETVTINNTATSISVRAIRDCVERGVQINIHGSDGRAIAKISSPTLVGTVAIRRAQMEAHHDHRGVEAARAFIRGRLMNQVNLLRYYGKYRKDAAPEVFRELQGRISAIRELAEELASLQGERIDDVRDQFFGVEGRAATNYWEAVKCLLKDKQDFVGRERRGAGDPVNKALNYGYGILYSVAWGALNTAGLEPFAGFLHTDRPGKPSLVLDFVEEFRSTVVDRPIIGLFTKGFNPDLDREEFFSEEDRRTLAERITQRLDGEERYGRQWYRLRSIMVHQARRLARFFRGEDRYEPFVGGW